MRMIKITESMMSSIEACVVDGGNTVWKDKETGVSTIEYNNQKFWFNAAGLDDDSLDYFYYDVTWEGVEDGEDEGSWSYSVKVGDSVEYFSDEA